jgi:CBS domain-containing protein
MKTRDVMTTPIVSVSPDADLVDAARLMLHNRISGLPVLNARHQLVGLLSEADLLRRPETGTAREQSPWFDALFGPAKSAREYVRTHGLKVRDVMARRPITIDCDAPLDKVVHLMESHGVKRFPVTRRGRVVGIVTRADLLRAFVSIHRHAPRASKSDGEVRRRIVEDIAAQSWAAGAAVEVIVRKGTVDLWGTITDVSQREALMTLARSVRGVKRVYDHLTWVARSIDGRGRRARDAWIDQDQSRPVDIARSRKSTSGRRV